MDDRRILKDSNWKDALENALKKDIGKKDRASLFLCVRRETTEDCAIRHTFGRL